MSRKRIGEILLERRLITAQQLEDALTYHRHTGHRVGASLVATGALSELTLVQALGDTLGLPSVDLSKVTPDWQALHLLDPRRCEARDLIPIEIEEHRGRRVLKVAMADPLNIPAIEEIEFTAKVKVMPVIAPLSQVRAAIRKYFKRQSDAPPRTADDERSGKMTLVRPGGDEEVVTTATGEMPGVRVGTPRAEPDPPKDDGDLPLVEGEEVTGRSALAEIIRRRAEQRAKRQKGKSTVGEDLSYLFGVRAADESEAIEKLESKFWALLRILAKKGLISQEEFVDELDKP